MFFGHTLLVTCVLKTSVSHCFRNKPNTAVHWMTEWILNMVLRDACTSKKTIAIISAKKWLWLQSMQLGGCAICRCWHIMFPPSYSCLLDANLRVLEKISRKKCFFFSGIVQMEVLCLGVWQWYYKQPNHFFCFCCNMTRTLNKEIADSAQTGYCATFPC